MLRHFIIVFFSLLSFNTFAQSWEVGGSVGFTGYTGDLNPVRIYKLTDPALGVLVKRNFSGYVSVKFNALFGKIQANDANSEIEQHRLRNLSFYSPVTELGAQLEFNFFNYIPSVSQKIYSPYLFVGLAGTFFNAKTVYDGDVYELINYATEGQEAYYKNVMSIPYGFGIKYNIRNNWSLIGEAGFRTTTTDYLDDVSGVYIDKLQTPLYSPVQIVLSDRSGEITGNYIGSPGTQRGDTRKRDYYSFVGISLTYTFVTSKCYVFK